jgi:hypothetical protein
MKLQFVLMLALAGCGESNPLPLTGDQSVARDMAMPQPDLSTVMNDLAVPTSNDLAVTSDLAMDNGDVTMAHGMVYKYVVNSLTAPMQRTDFAMDLNGDGHSDNQLGNVIAAMEAIGFDAVTNVAQSVAQGDTIDLVGFQTADPMLMNDDTAGVVLEAGQAHPNPDFSGNGSFTVDGKQPAAQLFGRLQVAAFSSNNPVTTTHPVMLSLQLGLFGSGMPIVLPLNGAHIQFSTGKDPKSGAPGLLMGQIHGSVKNSDVQNILIPALAQSLNQIITQDPNSANAMQVEQIFDTGGCVDANGTMAKANDGKIDPCEVSSNQIVQNVLAPDVQIYDQNGSYAPNKLNNMKDSFSVGVGFTAVKASF